MKIKLTRKFIEDLEPALEDLYREAKAGLTNIEYLSLINKIEVAPRTYRGKSYFIEIELTEIEARLLAGEAKYRAEFNSRLYLDDDLPIDRAANRAAIKVLTQLKEII